MAAAPDRAPAHFLAGLLGLPVPPGPAPPGGVVMPGVPGVGPSLGHPTAAAATSDYPQPARHFASQVSFKPNLAVSVHAEDSESTHFDQAAHRDKGPPTQTTTTTNLKAQQASRMASQATKVLKFLSQLQELDSASTVLSPNKKIDMKPTYIPRDGEERPIQEIAQLAKETLSKPRVDKVVQPVNPFVSYDVHRRGRVPYEDLTDVLIHSSAGLSKKEIRKLSECLDKEQTGEIEFRTILQAIDNIQPPAAATKPTNDSNTVVFDAPTNVSNIAEQPATSALQPFTAAGKQNKHNNVTFTTDSVAPTVSAPPSDEITSSKQSPAETVIAPKPNLSMNVDGRSNLNTNTSESDFLSTINTSYRGHFLHSHRRHLDPSSPLSPAAAGPRIAPYHVDLSEAEADRTRRVQEHVAKRRKSRRERRRASSAPPRSISTNNNNMSDATIDGSLDGSPNKEYFEAETENKNKNSDLIVSEVAGIRSDLYTPSTRRHFRSNIQMHELVSPDAHSQPATASANNDTQLEEPYRSGLRTSFVFDLDDTTSPNAYEHTNHHYSQAFTSSKGAVGSNPTSITYNGSNNVGSLETTIQGSPRFRARLENAFNSRGKDSVATLLDELPLSSLGDTKVRESTIDAPTQKQTEQHLIAQVSGRLLGFRNALKKEDVSDSGVLNFEELKAACNKFGVRLPQDKLKGLFDTFSKKSAVSGPTVDIGYTRGEVMDIHHLVDHVAQNSTVDRPTEEKRICRKVLHAADRLSDPMLIFRQLDDNFHGFVDRARLKEGIHYMGAVLNDREFDLLANKIESNRLVSHPSGLVHVTDINRVLHNDVNEADSEAKQRSWEVNTRHNDTFKVNPTIACYENFEFEDLNRVSKSYKTETYRTDKLKENLKKRYSKELLTCFQDIPGENDATKEKTTTSVPLGELTKRMNAAGVQWGLDDQTRYQNYMNQFMHNRRPKSDQHESGIEETKVGLDDFCAAMDLEVYRTPADQYVFEDKLVASKDGGIFANAGKSLKSHSTFATTVLTTDTETAPGIKGHQRRKPERPDYPHVTEPSRYWELPHSSDMLVPQPLGLVCDWPAYPSSFKVTLKEGQSASKLSAIAIENNQNRQNSNNHNHNTSEMANLIQQRTTEPAKSTIRVRSASAPPVRRNNPDAASVNSSLSSFAIGHSSVRNQTSKTMENVFKWGSKSLAELVATKTAAIDSGGGNGSHYDGSSHGGQSSTVRGAYIDSHQATAINNTMIAPIRSAVTSSHSAIQAQLNSRSAIGGTSGGNSRTLRKQLRSGDTSGAPYATNY